MCNKSVCGCEPHTKVVGLHLSVLSELHLVQLLLLTVRRRSLHGLDSCRHDVVEIQQHDVSTHQQMHKARGPVSK